MAATRLRALCVRPFFWLLSALAVTAWAPRLVEAQSVRVTAGTIEDRRTTGKFFAGLEIELKLTGDDLEGARAARVVLKKAVDETGRDLLPEEKKEEDFSKSGGGGPSLKLNLKNPARAASALTEVSGEVQLYVPSPTLRPSPRSTSSSREWTSRSPRPPSRGRTWS